jgi:hypothetical protein
LLGKNAFNARAFARHAGRHTKSRIGLRSIVVLIFSLAFASTLVASTGAGAAVLGGSHHPSSKPVASSWWSQLGSWSKHHHRVRPPTAPTTVSTPTPKPTKPPKSTPVAPPPVTSSSSSPVSVPPVPKTANNFCNTYPALPSSKPNASNTGVPPGVTLTSHGSMTVTKAGTVVDAMWIKGTLTIAANNVTVEDSKIEAAASGWYGISISGGVTGTRIIDNEIWGDDGGYIGINAPHAGSASIYTFVCGNHLHNWENDLTVGPNMMVQANFIDAMQNHQNDTDADGIENYYGGNNKFWGNNIMAYGPNGTSTSGINSALNITATGINISNVQVNGNWLGGGGGTLDLDQQRGATTTNVSLTDNVWYSTPKATYGPLSIHGSNMVSTWLDNTLSTGATLAK